MGKKPKKDRYISGPLQRFQVNDPSSSRIVFNDVLLKLNRSALVE